MLKENCKKQKRNLYFLITIIIVFIGITYVIAQTSKLKTWSSQADFVAGTLEDAQVNLDLTGTCDAKRYLSSGYDYPSHETNPAGTCNWCSGSGTDGIGTSENIPNGQDPFNECGGLECSDYYYGWVGVTCYYRDDVSATNRKCEGDGTCRDAADDCPNQEQGDSTGTSRTTCRTEVGCSGTTGPSLGYVSNGQDTYSDCGGLSCSGYYLGWSGNRCYYRANEPAGTHNCEGDGTCRDVADDCPSNGQGSATGCSSASSACRAGCSGTTGPTCYTSGQRGCGTCKVCNSAGNCVNANDCTSCGSNQVCRSGSCTTNYIVILAERPGGSNCGALCNNNGGRTCRDVGTDGSGTNNLVWRREGGGDCFTSSHYCGTMIGTGDNWQCSGHWVAWTNCRCSYCS